MDGDDNWGQQLVTLISKEKSDFFCLNRARRLHHSQSGAASAFPGGLFLQFLSSVLFKTHCAFCSSNNGNITNLHKYNRRARSVVDAACKRLSEGAK